MTAIAVPLPRSRARRRSLRSRIGIFLAGFSNYAENKVLDHITGKTAFTSPGPLYMALCTVAVAETDTGSTITEANYTGYARKQIATADWAAAASGSATTSAQQQFAACTAGTSTVIGWALCDASTAGNVIMFGTCTSTVISTTQTPATIAAGALTLTVD